MSRKLFVMLALAAVAVGIGSTAVNAATERVKSRVKITEGGPDLFEGKVTSKEAACEKRRKVRLLYGSGKGDTVVGTAKTDKHGLWSMPGVYYAGTYHAEVQAKSVEDEDDDTLKCGFATGITAQFRSSNKLSEIESKATREVKTNVKITEGGPDRFEGKVTSKNDKCLKKRKIRLEYTAGKRGGDVIATTRTDPAGNWAIEQSFYAGIYQVVVLQRVITAHLTCLGGHSRADHY